MTVPAADPRTLRVAVTQVVGRPTAAEQISAAERLARRAAALHAPDVIVLPEGLLSPRDAPTRVEPEDGPALAILRGVARDVGAWVAGGYVAIGEAGVSHLYALVEPDGSAHVHRKDAPDPWEATAVRGRPDDGFASTSLGGVALAMGGEWLRRETAFRAAGHVGLILGGSCWGRTDRPVAPAQTGQAPQHLARLVRAPAVHAALTRDPVSGAFAAAQIVASDGEVLVRLPDDQDDIGVAEVTLAAADLTVPSSAGPDLIVDVPHRVRWGWTSRTILRRLFAPKPAYEIGGTTLLAYNPVGPTRPEREIISNPTGVAPLPAPSLAQPLATIVSASSAA